MPSFVLKKATFLLSVAISALTSKPSALFPFAVLDVSFAPPASISIPSWSLLSARLPVSVAFPASIWTPLSPLSRSALLRIWAFGPWTKNPLFLVVVDRAPGHGVAGPGEDHAEGTRGDAEVQDLRGVALHVDGLVEAGDRAVLDRHVLAGAVYRSRP